jgi:hypothetical protein
MAVTPIPQTITLDLPKEYLDFLDMATQKKSLSHQDVIRGALAMLKVAFDNQPTDELLNEPMTFSGEKIDALKSEYFTAWDRWGKEGQQVPLDDSLAVFVAGEIADGTKDATGVVMLALLRYAKVMGLGFSDDYGEA